LSFLSGNEGQLLDAAAPMWILKSEFPKGARVFRIQQGNARTIATKGKTDEVYEAFDENAEFHVPSGLGH
jgi:hypothetical protein